MHKLKITTNLSRSVRRPKVGVAVKHLFTLQVNMYLFLAIGPSKIRSCPALGSAIMVSGNAIAEI